MILNVFLAFFTQKNVLLFVSFLLLITTTTTTTTTMFFNIKIYERARRRFPLPQNGGCVEELCEQKNLAKLFFANSVFFFPFLRLKFHRIHQAMINVALFFFFFLFNGPSSFQTPFSARCLLMNRGLKLATEQQHHHQQIPFSILQCF